MADEIIFEIDGVTMPMPSKGGFSITFADADGKGSGRNAKGYTRRHRLRRGIRTIEVKYKFINQTNSALVLNAISPEFVNVKYRDPLDGITTKRFYAGNRTVPAYGRTKNGVFMWEELSFNLIEQ